MGSDPVGVVVKVLVWQARSTRIVKHTQSARHPIYHRFLLFFQFWTAAGRSSKLQGPDNTKTPCS